MNIFFSKNLNQRASCFLDQNSAPKHARYFYLFPTMKQNVNLHDNSLILQKRKWKMHNKNSTAYQKLCTEYYDLDKKEAPPDAISFYLQCAARAKGSILEPMCGTGRFLIPLLKAGYDITGFDLSPHMLDICKKNCELAGLKTTLSQDSFESYLSSKQFDLIFIPTSSFCLLTNPEHANAALQKINSWLLPKGKFIFEVDTFHSKSHPEGIWKGSWLDKKDGSKLVLNTMANFDKKLCIDKILCRYELWEENKISKTEVEDFQVRLYALNEVDQLLKKHKFKIIKKSVPYTPETPNDKSETILYECSKE
jgi:SAM-dependent methyltransferase